MSDEYPKDWARLVVMVDPNGNLEGLSGDRNFGSSSLTGLQRINSNIERLQTKAALADKLAEDFNQILYQANTDALALPQDGSPAYEDGFIDGANCCHEKAVEALAQYNQLKESK